MAKYFHLTIGPVQGFVAQARRTRDFWSGSFILSWLAAVAMKSVQKLGGSIEFPAPDSDYLLWLEGKGKDQPPLQGGVPNRFKAMSAEVPQGFDPLIVADSIKLAWRSLAEIVWEKDFASALDKDERQKQVTKDIWDRQVNNFWEITWVITDDAVASSLLDRRKNWRNHYPGAEPGVKCSMMEGWQELSGAERPNFRVLDDFWKLIRARNKNDFREKEHLCALAAIKRRFAYHFESLQVAMVQVNGSSEWTLKGWRLPTNVPSVAYLAAVHWLEKLIAKSESPDVLVALVAFNEEALKLTGGYGERKTYIKCIDQALSKSKLNLEVANLDGDVFFDFLLENEDRFPRLGNRLRVLSALNKLKELTDLDSPSPYYAVLLMDGDSLGSQMSDPDKQVGISDALNQFTKQVPLIVSEQNGFLVYAGGDDVLAILPLEDAIPCAYAIRNCYKNCFDKVNKEKNIAIKTSLSGAIEYCHIKSPLLTGLYDSHHLLDDIAKEKTGRDSLAVRVWKPGGLHLQWSSPWEQMINHYTGKLELDRWLLDWSAKGKNAKVFSGKFVSKLRSQFGLLGLDDGQFSTEPDKIKPLMKLLYADYLKSFGGRQGEETVMTLQQFEAAMQFCGEYIRLEKNSAHVVESTKRWRADGLLLVDFLVTKGVGSEH